MFVFRAPWGMERGARRKKEGRKEGRKAAFFEPRARNPPGRTLISFLRLEGIARFVSLALLDSEVGKTPYSKSETKNAPSGLHAASNWRDVFGSSPRPKG